MAPKQRRLKEVGGSDYFYSDPAPDGARTLDDDITDAETPVSRILAAIRGHPVGAVISSRDAAEIVNHLVPRTAHVRTNIERGLRMMAHGIEAIFNDDDRIQSLMGLNEDEPNEVFRRNLKEKLDEIEGLEKLGLPEGLIEHFAFVMAKENFTVLMADILPMMRDAFSSWLETSGGFARETHNIAIVQTSRSLPRLELLENLIWSIKSAQAEGAILPDCAAIAVDRSGHVAPAMFVNWDDVAAIVLPVAPDKLLVGAVAGSEIMQSFDFNTEAARNSHDFFLAPKVSEYFAGLHMRLGEVSMKLIEDGVNAAMEPYFATAPEPKDRQAPLFPVDLIKQGSEPWQYELSLIDCGDEKDLQELSGAVNGIVASLAQALPLHRLDGITIASDYRAALVSLERGYAGAPTPDTAPEEIGQGMARTISVKREERWKDRIVLDARVAFALLSDESDTVEWALYTFVRQLADVALSEMVERHLPGVWMKPINDPLASFLYQNIHPAIFGYLGSHVSAGFGDALHHTDAKRELLINALREMKSAGLAARLEYRHHGDMNSLLGTVMPRISYALQFAAELLGHCAANGTDPFDADGELSVAFADVGLQRWFPTFRDQLERLRLRMGRWESFDEFLALNVHVERLMWQLGMLPWHGTDGIRIEVPLGTDIDKLVESVSN